MKKYCTRCGRQFESVGREVICPACREAAAEESKRAAVMRAKRASWNGESVPVRISGRASTIIRRYGAANGLPFVQALDDLLKSSDYFKGFGIAWEEVEPYKSRRRDKATTETTSTPQDVQEVKQAAGKPQDAPQDVTSKPQATQAAKTTSKTTTSKRTTAGKAVKKGEKTC